MTDATNMSTPVTRAELRAELEPLATKKELAPLATKKELEPLATKSELELAIARLATKEELELAIAPLATKKELEALATKKELELAIAPLATKVELELWGGALLARMDRRMDLFEQRMVASEQRLHVELARHTQAIQESLSKQVSVVDEKYTDLPRRVNRLEGVVFKSRKR